MQVKFGCNLQVCYNLTMLQESKRVRRSGCPVNFTVEVFGDKWSLLIVRDIIFFGKKTYGEFLKSDERIATNILNSKLVLLESEGILSKTPHPTDKRKDVYALTGKGEDLIPIIMEMFNWGLTYNTQETNVPEKLEEHASQKLIKQFRENKQKTIEQVRETVRGGGFVFSNAHR